ncbi:TRAP transporter substrate-binding protein [Rhodobacteraceae bacterium F11138]|nr:TRAP transporter substrate-binding protein [Rhodobacteraceae bacterium F11138]
MKRVLTATLAMAAFVTPAIAQESHTLKLSTFLPPGNVMAQEFERWGAELAEKSDGRLTLEIFNAAQMGPPPQQYDLVRKGVADISYALHGFTPGRFPLTELAYLPNLFSSAEQGSRALSAMVPEYLADEHRGTRLLYIVAAPPIGILTKDVRIDSAEALKGLRIRHPGSVIAASLTAAGAAPAAVPPGEMGDALDKGVIDGIATTVEAAAAFNFADMIGYKNDLNIGTGTFSLVMNPDSYASLPEDLQKLIDDTTGAAASERVGRIYDDSEASAWAAHKDHIEIVSMSEAETDELNAVLADFANSMIADLDAKGHPASAFYQDLAATLE